MALGQLSYLWSWGEICTVFLELLSAGVQTSHQDPNPSLLPSPKVCLATPWGGTSGFLVGVLLPEQCVVCSVCRCCRPGCHV